MLVQETKSLAAALFYTQMDYPIFPCAPGKKHPLTTNGFKDATTNEEQIREWFTKWPDANLGMPTAGMIVVDIDGSDNPWPQDPDQRFDLSKAVISKTPSGGTHYIFRQPPGLEYHNTIGQISEKVDTRASGGYILVPPSIIGGIYYKYMKGSALDCPLAELPTPPDWIMELLVKKPTKKGNLVGLFAGDDGLPIPKGQRNDALARLAGGMRRMGLSHGVIESALLKINEERCTPSLDDGEVKKIAKSVSRYQPDFGAQAIVENTYKKQGLDKMTVGGQPIEELKQYVKPMPKVKKEKEEFDRETMPETFFQVPGFISNVMDFTLRTSYHPNQTLAFVGALALQAYLAGRKIRDENNTRTNVYLLGLANSSVGKEQPRKTNSEILEGVGLENARSEKFASGESFEDALSATPSMLFQSDEIDAILQTINLRKDGAAENYMAMLLTLYSSSDGTYVMRRKANDDSGRVIRQPSLVLYGSAIPTNYYRALSERMLQNGFFARMIVFDCGFKTPPQEPGIQSVPEEIIEIGKHWAGFTPSKDGHGGNLSEFYPDPMIVKRTSRAKSILVECSHNCYKEYQEAEKLDDQTGMTVWGRVDEQTRKLALIYAASANYENPEVNEVSADWAVNVMDWVARRMLKMAGAYSHRDEFEADCKKTLARIARAKGKWVTKSKLLVSLKYRAKYQNEILDYLYQAEQISYEEAQGKQGSTVQQYRINY